MQDLPAKSYFRHHNQKALLDSHLIDDTRMDQIILQKPVTTILFDMDNTLFDLVGAQISACHAVAKFLGNDDGDALFEYFLRPARGFESHENILDYMIDRSLSHDGMYKKSCRIYETVKLRLAPSKNYHSESCCNCFFSRNPREMTSPNKSTFRLTAFLTERVV